MLRQSMSMTLGALVIAGLLLTACQPSQVEVPVTVVVKETSIQTVVETQVNTVIETQVVEVAKGAFTTPHPILSDVRNRQGIAYCANREELIASVYPWIEDKSSLQMDTFIPKSHWAYTQPSESYAFDLEKGQALFTEAGWTLAEGATFRTNEAGDEMQLKFTTTTAQFRQTWAAVFEANMAACGLRVLRFHVPASWWFGDTTGLARRDFELGAFAWVGQADPGGVALYACDQIPLPENGWVGQNGMGWCNEAASNGIKLANNTLNKQERIDNYAIVQEEFAKDMVSLPLFNRANVFAHNPTLTGFSITPGEQFLTWNIQDWEIPGQDTLVFAFTQEPASLFALVESAQVAAIATNLVYGQGIATANYDFQPVLYKQLPSLENGGAVMNEVDVKEGDVIVDANGDVGPLSAGMKVLNSAGETVEFTGGMVKMNQLVITGELLDGITWSDGTPVTAADLELSDKIACDKESGATSFFNCDRTASIEYPNGTTAVYTLVPGYQPPLYFTFVPGAFGAPTVYPSQRVLSDGRKLADVPAAEWATLPEIAESPMGYGPYMVTGWEKGQSMSFAANPNFILGAPKTPNLIITFVADTNQAVAQLLTGDVDILDDTTLGAGSEVQTVIDAAKEGKVITLIEPSATWEHIDMNMFVK